MLMRKGLLTLLPLFLLSQISAAFADLSGVFESLAPKGLPTISAQSAVVMDWKTGKVLWSKAPDTRRYPASTTKIMTAMLLIENCKLDEVITAPADIEKVEESSLHLKPGEKVTTRDMLYALMLRSANDGSYAVARHISGSIEAFAELMNQRAAELGCTNTTFCNPHGLNNDDHMTTARDLALIARQAMQYQEFRDVVKTYKYTITRSINKGDSNLVSKNKWLKKDGTADGIKTGYTRPAGKCYVGSATRNGYRVITVVLKSDDWQSDHKAMLDWAFANHERTPVAKAGEVVGSAPIDGGQLSEVKAVLSSDVDTIAQKGKPLPVQRQVVFHSGLRAPLTKGQIVGEAVYSDSSGFKQSIPVVAVEDVPASVPILAAVASNTGLLFTVGGLCGTGLLVRRRRRIRRRLAYATRQKL
jgi:serine-type D-Ala-D-Ala carboxypeptidase (penicillin-binding protein 5/6)